MSYNIVDNKKPHAVLIPYPVQGHINPLFKFAKLLHLRGFHITFVNTEYNQRRLLKSNALESFTDFIFETIPDGLTPSHGDGDVTQHIPSLNQSIRTNFLQPFRQLLLRLNHSATSPPISCIVYDFSMAFSKQAAEEFALPHALFFPASACTLLSVLHSPSFVEFLSSSEETKIDWIPGLQNFRLKDIPNFVRTKYPNFITESADRVSKDSTIVLNTFDELESNVINSLSSMFPSLYPIGPLPSLLNQVQENHHTLESLGSNLWKEDTKCLDWLESKESRSVVYVNFGSITVMTPEQLLEFAWGLANTNICFLWIIRPDLVIGGSVILSSEFVNETSDRGLIASWCPQEKVLNHPSIGGFLTHCGWNSTIESVCAGVPMLCWPFFADQPMNCRYICNEWEIGIEIDTNVKREEVEKLVKELMVGENGKKMRQKTVELKKKAEEYTRLGGCSYMNLDKVIKVLLKQN